MCLKKLLTETNSEGKKLHGSTDVLLMHLMFTQTTEHQTPMGYFGCESQAEENRGKVFLQRFQMGDRRDSRLAEFGPQASLKTD